MNSQAVEADGSAKSKSPQSRRITVVVVGHTTVKKTIVQNMQKLMKGTYRLNTT